MSKNEIKCEMCGKKLKEGVQFTYFEIENEKFDIITTVYLCAQCAYIKTEFTNRQLRKDHPRVTRKLDKKVAEFYETVNALKDLLD